MTREERLHNYSLALLGHPNFSRKPADIAKFASEFVDAEDKCIGMVEADFKPMPTRAFRELVRIDYRRDDFTDTVVVVATLKLSLDESIPISKIGSTRQETKMALAAVANATKQRLWDHMRRIMTDEN